MKIKVDWERLITKQTVSANRKQEAAIRYLAETDWYVIRAMETGVPVPGDVLNMRSSAREALTGQA